MNSTYRCVIFDWDGTLADTISELAGLINQALAERGYAPAKTEDYLKTQGRPLEDHVLFALPPEDRSAALANELAARALRLWKEAPLNLARHFPGVPELVAALCNKKITCAVLSNKPEPALHAEISRLYPDGSFNAIRGVTPGAPYKPDPAAVWELLAELDKHPGSTILASDSETDMKAAITSGCLPVGVLWGYRNAQVLKEAGARRLIATPAELLELL